MNNNCTKCGNPLQPGTTICPVCGTNNINAAPAAQPAQPVAQPTTAMPAVDPATGAPMAQPVAQPTTAMPTVDPTTGVQPAVQPTQPVAQPTTAMPTVDATPVAPVATQPEAPTQPVAQGKPAKEKKPVNKKLLIILGVGALLIVVVAVVLIFVLGQSAEPAPSNESSSSDNLKPPARVASGATLTINGYSFKTPDGWKTNTTTEGISVYDAGPTTIVQLTRISGDLESADETSIKGSLEMDGYTNVEYSKTKINDKDAIIIKAGHNESAYIYEFYYISSDESIIGGSVVYTGSEASSTNSSKVSELMNSLSYDSTANALEDKSEFIGAEIKYSNLLSPSSSGDNNVDDNTSNNESSNGSSENSNDSSNTNDNSNPDNSSGTSNDDEGGF